jgi:putative ABC transport system substrate-binding protein
MIGIKNSLLVISLAFIIFVDAPIQAAGNITDKELIYVVLWRGCEEGCKGFSEYISNSDLNAEIVIRDADGDKTKFPEWVKEARSLNADLVITWGTSVTLGMVGTLADNHNKDFINKIPVVFMIVSDPVGSNIIESYAKTGRDNVTGTRNRPPDSVYIKAIRSYNPKFKKLGMLFNSNEPNSVQKVKEIEALTKHMKFELVGVDLKIGADGHPLKEDISAGLKELRAAGVDFIYMGSSSFLRNYQDLFTETAVANGLPVLSPYENTVLNSNALLSVAASYEDVGRLAGKQALAILLEGKIPGELPVRSVSQYSYLVNMKVAKQLNLYPSVKILQFAKIIE